jgi:hypothetical protein
LADAEHKFVAIVTTKEDTVMKLSKLQMLGGISLIAGSLLLTAYSVSYFTLLPVEYGF